MADAPDKKPRNKAHKSDGREHVVLSSETVKKLLKATEPRMISPWDLLELERSETALKAAEAAYKLKKAEETQRKFAMELATIRHDAEVRVAMDDVRGRMDEHRKLADALADRYHFSWSSHSYNPSTGEVIESGTEG